MWHNSSTCCLLGKGHRERSSPSARSQLGGTPQTQRSLRMTSAAQLHQAVAVGGGELHAAVTAVRGGPFALEGKDTSSLALPGGGACTFAAAGGELPCERFADCSVRAGDRSWPANRVVLAAASPGFRSMLESDMQEGRNAEVVLQDADAGAVELLLRHIYGGAIEVPLGVALALYSLADQYCLKSDLAPRLRRWLAALPLTEEALAALAPAAYACCRTLWEGSWRWELVDSWDNLLSLAAKPSLATWSVDMLVSVMHVADPAPAFALAAVWMDILPDAADRRRL